MKRKEEHYEEALVTQAAINVKAFTDTSEVFKPQIRVEFFQMVPHENLK